MKRDIKEILRMVKCGEISPEQGKQLMQNMSQKNQSIISDDTFLRDRKENEYMSSVHSDFVHKTVVLDKPGNISDIQISTIDLSDPAEKEVQILVKAFSLNFGDLLCVKGLYPTMPDYPFSPGFEISGVVVKTGAGVTRVKAGDEVIGLMGERLGGQSLIVNTDESFVVKKPKNITHEEACSFPIVYLTMQHVFDKAMIKKGEKVLIQTATGGTGLIAVQMAFLQGAEIYATAGSQEKLDYLRKMGVKHLINYREEDFAEKVLEMTNGHGIDVLINTLSGDAIQKGLEILAPQGRYLEIAMTGLKSAKHIDLSYLVNNQTFYSVDMRKLMLNKKQATIQYLDRMYEVLEKGSIKPTVDKVFSFSEIQKAYRYLENRKNIGKVVVTTPLSYWNHQTKIMLSNEKCVKNREKMIVDSQREVAIIGMSCRFPGAKNKDEFWNNLANGVSSIKEVPKERWDSKAYYDPDLKKLDKTNCKWGGFLEDIDQFDSLFFNISGKEAELSDPQQRLLLEESWNALEDAGYANDYIGNKKCSVFVGISNGDYVDKMNELGVPKEAQSFWGNHNSVSVARISYFLNLKGPSIAIDTACSSALVSTHMGCQSIASGESELVLTGGAFINVTPKFFIASSNANMLSPEGKSAAFDNNANGFVPGEGVVMFVLKPLDAALEDGDHIYGVIKSSGTNQDGRTNGITAPSTISQTELEQFVYEKGNINPETITYVETHGTSTKLGDPIEIEALTNAFCKYTDKKQYCAIGSVKTNIGHAATAAGGASLAKVLLSLKHKKIPPSLNFCTPNEHIDFESSPFYVNSELKDWKVEPGEKRRAAISSFGFSGTNAHLVIEEPPQKTLSNSSEGLYFVPFSARNEDALQQQLQNLRSWLEKESACSIGDLCYTLLVGRKHFAVRSALLVRNIAELKQKLVDLCENKNISNYLISDRKKSSHKENALAKEMGEKLIREFKEENVKGEKYKEKLWSLLELYVNGYKLDWNKFYEGSNYQRLPLPTYPFSYQRFWLNQENETIVNSTIQESIQSQREWLHPLIEKNNSDLEEYKFTTKMTGDEFYLSDHIINKEKVLPGVAYIEMIRAAGELVGKRKVKKIKNLVWKSPIKVYSSSQDIHIKLHPRQTDVQYEIFSGENEKRTIHHHGKFIFENDDVQPERINIDSVMQRCEKLIDGHEMYNLITQRNLHLGSSFQVIQERFGNNKEFVSTIQLPQKLIDGSDKFELHPSLMDGAFQTALLGKGYKELYVPFSIDEVEIFRNLKNAYYVYAICTKDTEGKLGKFDIYILDETGQVLVKIKDFIAKPFFGEKEASSPLYFKNVWEPVKLKSSGDMAPLEKIIIFDESEELWNSVRGNSSSIILVKRGNGYQKISDQMYVIDPSCESDYVRLIQTLKEEDLFPKHILYLWANGNRSENNESIEEELNRGIYSVFFLTKALMSESLIEQVQFIYTYAQKNGLSKPIQAALSGFFKSVRIENSKFICQSIALETYSKSDILERVLPELEDTSESLEVRYVNGQRFVKFMREFQFKEEEKNTLPWRQKGVYLITGGLGGIGFLFAQYLAKEFKAKLVLVGRSDLTSDKKARLEELISYGAEILYIKADISKRQEVESLISKTKEQYYEIHGILHCAGVIRDAIIKKKTNEQITQVLAPKIFGTIWLDEATKNEKLDLFVLFSSTTAVIGNIGQSDYAYANAFMDQFSESREQLVKASHRFGRTLSINWPLWKEGGMKMDKSMEKLMTKTIGMMPLRTATGIYAVEQGLIHSENQFVILQGARDKMKKLVGDMGCSTNTKDNASTYQPTEGTIQNENSLIEKLQQDLIEIVADILKINQQDIYLDEEMSEFGFDSLSLTDLSNKINERFNIEIIPAIFFEYSRLDSVVDYLIEEYSEQIVQCYTGERVQTESVLPEKPEDPPVQSSELLIGGTISTKELHREETIKTKEEKQMEILEPVAIIGMSGIMPQSEDLDVFWKHLVKEKDLISEIPNDRWDWKELYGDPVSGSNKTNIKWGGFMGDIDKFDSLFFGISPKEAELMDPQQRILMENVWKTIEDAGYKASELSGTRTGIFIGVSSSDYGDLQTQSEIQAQTSTGMSHCILTNRISYLLNLHGPSEPIDTACSSSLVAIHRAIEQIQNGECELAIAGGINVIASPTLYLSFNKAGMLCEDGRCKTFDKDANGYVRGEGVGTLLLKPLSRAEADGDHIYGVIKGSAVNHGGRANSLTAPNPNAQADLIIRAWRKAKVDPSTASYIETHGTGTALGDPIEINGLKKAFNQLYKEWGKSVSEEKKCGIGSVKTNIGHIEAAAGIAGICKVLLAMKNNVLPASIHYKELNPYIKLEDSPFYIVNKTTPWKQIRDEHSRIIPRRAGISSFGFGGVNAHIVIEEYQKPSNKQEVVTHESQIIILSAKNEECLKEYARNIVTSIQENYSLEDIAYTLQIGRESMEERLAVIVDNKEELKERLTKYCEGNKEIPHFYHGTVTVQQAKRMGKEGEGREYIEARIREKDYMELSQLWIVGAEIDWGLLHSEGSPKRISLATYPFERVCHWVSERKVRHLFEKQEEGTIDRHPLIDQNISTLLETKFMKCLQRDTFYLKDHVVQGKETLPGVAYLEMAYAAGTAVAEKSVQKITNVIWTQPIILEDDGERDIYIKFNKNAENTSYEIYSMQSDNKMTLHSQGNLEFESPNVVTQQEFVDLANIREECKQSKEGEECYQLFQKIGLTYGTSFKGIKKLYHNERECLSYIELPKVMERSLEDFVLHPSLMDAAIQSVIGLLGHKQSETLYLPFGIGELEILNELTSNCYAYIALCNQPTSSDAYKFNIKITDENGKVLINIKELLVYPFQRQSTFTTTKSVNQNDKKSVIMEILQKVENGELHPDKANKLMEDLLHA
ncbi:SDR family NAD(P)-dependent oxidoreductase [Bacillus sp. DX4.1]|uniref:SDR family NAD(P)-dependent oxidoreductase n=1 Tax=Bacillus sp. DX4.1 TaxID=3055867 RepID=UPI0025A18F95|nr:SDR family NAD(P)-dependent oxidoreductase [Bacillus sp. DX4.1]MDM5187018.1 SDR family NAD(P)-dependent oxidoreductase [Bacillus sp. DX4.1]